MTLQELYSAIKDIDVSYDYDDTYTTIYNTVIDYMNESQDFSFEYLFEEYIDYYLAEELAKRELEDGGLLRLGYFLGDAELNRDLFKIDGYGNLTDVDIDDLNYLKDELLSEIEDKLDEESE